MDDTKMISEISKLIETKLEAQDKRLTGFIDTKLVAQEKKLGEVMDVKLEEQNKRLEGLIEVKVENRIKELENKLLDWKSEIMNAVDTFALEIKESREYREIIGHQTTSNTDRIENLEKKTFGAVVGDV